MWQYVPLLDLALLSSGAGIAPAPTAPTVTSFVPAAGPVGTPVVLTGTNFIGATSVQIGVVACTFTVLSATSISLVIPVGAVDGAFTVTNAAGTGNSATPFDVTVAGAASTLTLRWLLEAYPATQSGSTTRTLLRSSRNAIIVRDVVDVESDTYQTPESIAWAVLEGADVAIDGALTLTSGRWRGEIVLDPTFALGTGPVLRITASLGGASWTRDYALTISAQE